MGSALLVTARCEAPWQCSPTLWSGLPVRVTGDSASNRRMRR